MFGKANSPFGAVLSRSIALSLILAFVACSAPPGKQATASADKLVGIWGCETAFGPAVLGELIIDVRDDEWRASIAGFDVPVKRETNSISFSLPGGQGEFRGHLSADSASLTGSWIQPAGTTLNNRYATPVHFAATAKSVWKGLVLPLDDRLSLYVSIQREQDGSLSAFIANPEFNFFRRRKFSVERTADAVTLSAKEMKLDGTFDEKNDLLLLPAVDSQPALRFTRRDRYTAVGFYPRTSPLGEKFAYRTPVADNDGWATASLQDVGLDSLKISALVNKILSASLADNPTYLQSLLIARHGKLVLEEYFYGFSRDRAHDMRSAGKTFAPVLVGLARDRGAKLAPDTPVYSLFPQYKDFANPSDRKKRVTLRDIMTMTAGNACDDSDDSSPGNEDNMQSQEAQRDWYKYALDLPMVADPGGAHAIYCSADLNLVGGTVASATGKWLPDLFAEALASPLQFGTYHLNLMPTGEAYLGGGAYLRPRDELKLGQLYLNGGVWNGRRVVSKQWVEESTAHHSSFEPAMKEEGEHQYGYGWHIHHLNFQGRVYRAFSAGGNGGQQVIVIPDLDLVVGFNGGSYGEFAKWYRWEFELLPQFILAAAQAPPPR